MYQERLECCKIAFSTLIHLTVSHGTQEPSQN